MFGIIGGSGFSDSDWIESIDKKTVKTEFGHVDVTVGEVNHRKFIFIARHGSDHRLPPHMINYRANIAAMAELGVSNIVATNAVGGIGSDLAPGKFALPDQIIDYTWGREQTFFSSFADELKHIDFTYPFDETLRAKIRSCFKAIDEPLINQGCYGCTQGPRLETAAEIKKMKNDGCTMVGMTGMPEAALARELDIPYASICFSVNWCAGIGDDISMNEIMANLKTCTSKLHQVINLLFD